MHYKIWVSLDENTFLFVHQFIITPCLHCIIVRRALSSRLYRKKSQLSGKHNHSTKIVEGTRLFLFRLEIAKSLNPLNGVGAESHRAGGGMCVRRWGDRDKELPHTLVSASQKLKKATAAEEEAPAIRTRLGAISLNEKLRTKPKSSYIHLFSSPDI